MGVTQARLFEDQHRDLAGARDSLTPYLVEDPVRSGYNVPGAEIEQLFDCYPEGWVAQEEHPVFAGR